MLLNANSLHPFPLADKSVQCCVTSIPYWNLRDYGLPPVVIGGDRDCAHVWNGAMRKGKSGGHNSPKQQIKGVANYGEYPGSEHHTCGVCGAWRGQLGLEPTPEMYVEHIVMVFREVWRVLRDDGVIWVNVGDSYSNQGKTGGSGGNKNYTSVAGGYNRGKRETGLKPKDLVGIPWMVAFALRADGWILRSDCIWDKPNAMPESVEDRPTKSHEYIFLLAKQGRYYYNAEAVKEPKAQSTVGDKRTNDNGQRRDRHYPGAPSNGGTNLGGSDGGRNKRTVWRVPTDSFSGAHFAVFPPALVEPCILAGCPAGGIVLDPFCGSGTTGAVARKHGRRFVGLDLNPTYLRDLALPRAEGRQTAVSIAALPLFAQEAE